jgi:5-methylcytosine-specific restriction endonuclease McrA
LSIQKPLDRAISRIESLALELGTDIFWRAIDVLKKRKRAIGLSSYKKHTVPRSWTEAAFRKQNGFCNRCGGELKWRTMHGDHIVSLAQGGEHKPSNTQALCQHCNLSKGANSLLQESKKTGQTILDQLRK